MPAQDATRYSAPTQLIHWVTAILVVVAFVYGPGGSEERVYAAARDFERQLHETLGISVLALVALRLLWRVFDRRPAPAPGARWMAIAAGVVQGALYVLLFAVPLSAIAGAWLEGHALTLLGGVQVPPPLSEHHAFGETIAEIHTWLGDAILWTAGLHAIAGLFHHFVLKDGVLISMLPFNRKGDPG
ncbi:MAG: cytochrome b [Casimicrobiaceae bacterium]